MIVDVHGHLGRTADTQRDQAALHTYVETCRLHRLLVSNLSAASAGEHARGVHEHDANVASLEAASRLKRLSAVYWVRPGQIDSNPHAVAGALEMEPFVALVLAPRWNEFQADDAILDPYISAAARLDRPVLIVSGKEERSRPRRVYALAQRFPRHAFVLLNSSADAHWSEAIECVQGSTKRGDALLYLTTAHMPIDELLKAIHTVGSGRMLFGSDAVNDPERHSDQVKEQIEAMRAALAPDDANRILSSNALDLFAIPRTP